MTPLRDATVTLADGRRLAYAEWGDPDGKPLFFFYSDSRLYRPDEETTRSAAVLLITVDQPGIGRSDVLQARTWDDWPADVVGLADALGIDRFAVVGWSGGGPYAAACAALIPARLTAAGVMSAGRLYSLDVAERPGAYEELTPEQRTEYDLAQKDPLAAADHAARRLADRVARLQTNPESVIRPADLPECDRWFFADEARARDFYAATRDGVRQGVDGYRWEVIMASRTTCFAKRNSTSSCSGSPTACWSPGPMPGTSDSPSTGTRFWPL